ncbi:hypothetical protein A1Q2_04110 [Trichosporon asahii var. asahii CBS 8904]|uniref:Uncharacterized protein n=1 Tax=Trichosporon asahii var. asahii (strain CBS 8904) TaxID=1220162 RepID=K1WJF9_TRIAC|nr:hypothetical protein A1Q2_04110 [Trichosporon asahii var. asahii CBS 8904]
MARSAQVSQAKAGVAEAVAAGQQGTQAASTNRASDRSITAIESQNDPRQRTVVEMKRSMRQKRAALEWAFSRGWSEASRADCHE